MSETEKPLHVRVAEALGWTVLPHSNKYGHGIAWSACSQGSDSLIKIPRYDTDWSATGPLIEKYQIMLIRTANGWHAFIAEAMRRIMLDGFVSGDFADPADTPLLATCHLILALHQAGKLNP